MQAVWKFCVFIVFWLMACQTKSNHKLQLPVYCVSMGGHLASIHDSATQNFLVSTAFGIVSGEWWIGGSDEAFEGHFSWTDHTPFDVVFWDDGEPNNAGGNENCVHLASWANGRWNDIPCEPALPYVCQIP